MSLVENGSRPCCATRHFATWYVLGAIAAVFIGWVAAALNLAGYAPLGILPLAVGSALGAALAGLAASTRVDFGRRLLIGATVLALVAVLAEHAWLYRDFRRQWHEARANSPHVALFRPEAPWSPAVYFRHEATPQQVALWCLDAALITAATIATMTIGRRAIIRKLSDGKHAGP